MCVIMIIHQLSDSACASRALLGSYELNYFVMLLQKGAICLEKVIRIFRKQILNPPLKHFLDPCAQVQSGQAVATGLRFIEM